MKKTEVTFSKVKTQKALFSGCSFRKILGEFIRQNE